MYELNGRKISKGEKVVLWFVSGNYDDTAIEQPNEFWIDRPSVKTTCPSGLASTAGMGNRLAEMQLRILWEEALQRFETIEVVGEPKRTCNLFIRGLPSCRSTSAISV